MVTHLWAWRDAVMCDSNSTNSHVAAPWRRVRDTHTLTPTHAHLVYQCAGCLGSSMFLECLTTYFFLFFLLRAFFFPFLLRTQFTSVYWRKCQPQGQLRRGASSWCGIQVFPPVTEL